MRSSSSNLEKPKLVICISLAENNKSPVLENNYLAMNTKDKKFSIKNENDVNSIINKIKDIAKISKEMSKDIIDEIDKEISKDEKFEIYFKITFHKLQK